MRHVLSVLVDNKPGILAKIAGLFSRRGYNIESLAVGETENPAVSRMTIVASGDDIIIEQINKQLNKLINVKKVIDLTTTQQEFVGRELLLLKVNVDNQSRSEIMQIVDIFRVRIVDVAQNSLIIEATGNEGKLGAIINLLKRFGLKELVRTGKIAMARGV